MTKDMISAYSTCICVCCFLIPLSLSLITAIVFLDFYVGWAIQWNHFNGTGNALAEGFDQLFVTPPVTDSWSIFSCFLFGFLIIKVSLSFVGIVVSICCGCCAGCCAMCTEEGRKERQSLLDFSEIEIPHYNGV